MGRGPAVRCSALAAATIALAGLAAACDPVYVIARRAPLTGAGAKEVRKALISDPTLGVTEPKLSRDEQSAGTRWFYCEREDLILSVSVASDPGEVRVAISDMHRPNAAEKRQWNAHLDYVCSRLHSQVEGVGPWTYIDDSEPTKLGRGLAAAFLGACLLGAGIAVALVGILIARARSRAGPPAARGGELPQATTGGR